VADSPFAAGFGPAPGPVCAPITGMLRAVARVVLGADAVAEETRCAANGHERCEFEASVPDPVDAREG
jgi:predicted hydrocarbon binding protein